MSPEHIERLNAVLAKLPSNAAPRILLFAVDRFAVGVGQSFIGLCDEAMIKYVERYTAGELCRTCGVPLDGNMAAVPQPTTGRCWYRGCRSREERS